ncbi:MAG: hypothetical protein ACR2O1_01335 [Boseongicola sp.]
MFKPVFIALLFTVAGAFASAGPNPQLVSSVESGLAHYGLYPDVSSLDTHTVARLHMTLSSRQTDGRKVRELKSILRKAKRRHPEPK